MGLGDQETQPAGMGRDSDAVVSLASLRLSLSLERSPGEGNGNPLQYCCLENPHGQRSLADYSPWGCKESDTTERLTITPHSQFHSGVEGVPSKIPPPLYFQQEGAWPSCSEQARTCTGAAGSALGCGPFFVLGTTSLPPP